MGPLGIWHIFFVEDITKAKEIKVVRQFDLLKFSLFFCRELSVRGFDMSGLCFELLSSYKHLAIGIPSGIQSDIKRSRCGSNEDRTSSNVAKGGYSW